MENNFTGGAGAGVGTHRDDLVDTKRKRLQLAAIIFLKEAKLRQMSVESIVEEFAGLNQVQGKLEHQDIGFCMATGIAIARRRRQLSMSQKRLGELTGLQRTYISDLESGRRNISLLNLVALADALSQPASALLESIEQIRTE